MRSFLLALAFFYSFQQCIASDFWQKVGITQDHAFQKIAFDSTSGHLFAMIYQSGIYKSTDRGESWFKVNTDVNNFSDLIIDNLGNIYASANGSGIYKSTDAGASWFKVNKGLGSEKIITLAIDDKGSIYSASWFDPGVYVSGDKGANWSSLNFKNGDVHALLILGGRIIAGTEFNGVYTTNDSGLHWSLTGLNGIDIFDFAQINGRIFAGTSQGIYISNDTGQTWQKKNSGIKYPYVNSLLANRSNFVFAATSGGGVFRSTDNGETWLELNSGLSDSLIKTLTIDNNDYIYAGTSKSIYRSRVLASPVAEYALPRYEKGISVYPNPFSYSATVSLNIQNPVQVKIKIINSTGQEVKSIENRYLDIGEHRYTLIADGLPSGLYFIIAENGMNCSSEIIVLAR